MAQGSKVRQVTSVVGSAEYLIGLDAHGNTVALGGEESGVGVLTAQEAADISSLMTDWDTYEPTRGGSVSTAIQFRGVADTAASLGTIGLVINSASDTAAGNRLAASDADWMSEINGASTAGRSRFVGPFGGAITRVHVAQLGLTAPLTDNASGPVLAASNQMTELNFDSALNVTALLVVEGAPTDFAGASGTGSARYVVIYGLAEASE